MNKRFFCIFAFLLIGICASTLSYAQLPYRSDSGSNTNSGMSGLNSFMRNSSQGDGLSKYLANNQSNSTVRKNPTHTASESPVSQNGTGILPYTNSPLNNPILSGSSSQNQSNLSQNRSNSPIQQYKPQAIQSQNLLSDYNLNTSAPTQTSSDDIARTLAEITVRLNTLQQKLESGEYSKQATSNNVPPYMSSSTTTVAAPSELYSGIENSSTFRIPSSTTQNSALSTNYESGYLGNNTNLNQFNSSYSQVNPQQYLSSNLSNISQQEPTYNSLDEIKAKLDEMSRSIDSHMQTNNTNSNSGMQNTSSGTAQQYPDFSTYSQSQFDRYFNTAQQQLMRGNYYEAADSFTLASVYEPENPSCYAGQAHALFAAGQFISSAIYIIRAIELNPDYIQMNIDLMTVTGSRDVVISRTNELEQLLKKAPATGLQILMAYVYYRTGRLADARQIINAVYQETPNSRPALALKIAIDTKINYSR